MHSQFDRLRSRSLCVDGFQSVLLRKCDEAESRTWICCADLRSPHLIDKLQLREHLAGGRCTRLDKRRMGVIVVL